MNFNRNANRSAVDLEGNRSNITVDDSGVSNWGWSVGAMFNPTENLRVGFSYRSEIILEAEGGEATFANFPNTTAAGAPQNGQTTFDAELPLPAELTLGVSYEHKKWLFAFDYNRPILGCI